MKLKEAIRQRAKENTVEEEMPRTSVDQQKQLTYQSITPCVEEELLQEQKYQSPALEDGLSFIAVEV